ncbi:acyl-homoserine-lactone synthase [Sphingomonas oryzagri]
MLLTVDATNRFDERVALRAMFEARKRVFVDLLKWDVPVLDGRFEIDQFDREHARYIVLMEDADIHLGSARLLPATRPGILDSLYPELCEEPLPSGDAVFEITRFCISPDGTAERRRAIRNELVVALAQYALAAGIESYTGVAELGWSRQILAFGWECRLLGPPQRVGKATLGAIRIDITPDIVERLAANGVRVSAGDASPTAQAA